MQSHEKSARLYAEAQRVIPGGVNSPVRAFKSVGGDPLFMQRGEGPYIFDVDGNRYIDHVMSWGPLIFGHAPPQHHPGRHGRGGTRDVLRGQHGSRSAAGREDRRRRAVR